MTRGTGITTSLVLIATGAVLSFAVTARANGIDINTVGVILMLVGFIGLLYSFLALGEPWWGAPRGDSSIEPGVTPPHTHERHNTRDVVIEDDAVRVERVRDVFR